MSINSFIMSTPGKQNFTIELTFFCVRLKILRFAISNKNIFFFVKIKNR
jgi:hypothetical protein